MSDAQTPLQEAQATLERLQLEQQTIASQLAAAGAAGDIDAQLQLERRADELPRRISLQQARVFRLANERDTERRPALEQNARAAAEKSLRAREAKEKAARLAQVAEAEAHNLRQAIRDLDADVNAREREISRLENESRATRGVALHMRPQHAA